MHKPDFAEFRQMLDGCATVFGRDKPNDQAVQLYWDCLKDLALSTVVLCAQQQMRYGKFFPKPFELRPKEDRPAVVRDSASEAKFREGEARAVANLEDLRRQDPVAWRAEVQTRYEARLIATQPTSSVLYAEALKGWQKTLAR